MSSRLLAGGKAHGNELTGQRNAPRSVGARPACCRAAAAHISTASSSRTMSLITDQIER